MSDYEKFRLQWMLDHGHSPVSYTHQMWIRDRVQGDVGCGKTIVAILMMAVLAENGYQAVLMAPTQVLAKQHYADRVSYTHLDVYKRQGEYPA